MVFTPPSWVPPLPEIPDDITLEEFLNDPKHGRHPIPASRNPYTCGLTGKTYPYAEVVRRTELVARAVSRRLGFEARDAAGATEWDRVVGLFSLNTVDYIPLTHAVHRLGGIVTPASAAYSPEELEHQLRSSGARALFTCAPLLATALKAASAVGIPEEKIFLLPVPGGDEKRKHGSFTTFDDLVAEGEGLPPTPPLNWIKGQAERQVAYLCYSSGTSGLPKAVMISHKNVIANVLQARTFEAVPYAALGVGPQVALGLLPLSHIYGLTLNALVPQYRGDEVVILPRFELATFLAAVQRHGIQRLNIVPPIMIQVVQNKDKCDAYDLSSVRTVFSGAAPMGVELIQDVNKQYPKWNICQGYGMTESSPLVTTTSELDIQTGSSGSLIPGTRAKIVDPDGNEVTAHGRRGEMLVQSPSVVLGYLNNEKANAETFVHHPDGRWLRTGDEVLVRLSANGFEHFDIVDRIKELIKVKGHQVAPAELEAHLLAHDCVADCAVIPVIDERAGEVPKAFVVRDNAAAGKSDDELTKILHKHVEEAKARHKWLKGGIEFIDAIPKSPSGKILRRMLRDKEKEKRRQQGAKL
ncbi:hypothetical protein N3K66_000124 [Trichothecium roseum]|uniref:Uncharacterized protein n=1 Tax=Trichothecium roseum TaxID=47278 RepID=A0ACC0VAY9_9HYPO|nr:hypothetical protein N3K66_000124 [Trichothecium roseum]